jgi:hypothetical protein
MTHPYLRLSLVSPTPGRAPTCAELVESLCHQLGLERGALAGCRLPPVRVLGWLVPQFNLPTEAIFVFAAGLYCLAGMVAFRSMDGKNEPMKPVHKGADL